MAGRDRIIDPLTRDYVRDTSTGSWQTTRTARTAVYHAIQGHFGKWAGDPNAGSRFFELARAKSSMRTPKVIEDTLRDALQPLVDEGRITAPVVLIERQVDRIVLDATVTDLQSGEEISLVDLLPFEV